MDSPVVNLNRSRTSRPKHASPPSLPPDGCQCSRLYQLARKLGCAVLILLTLTVIGVSVSVRVLTQKSSVGKSSVDGQEDPTEKTECPLGCYTLRNKCLWFSQDSGSWNESLTDCSTKEFTLLLVEDQEEWIDIQNLKKIKENLFWIGLSYTSEKVWKWTNGSVFNSGVSGNSQQARYRMKRLQIIGIAKEGSCVVVTQDRMFADYCDTDNHWICQKDRKPV